MIDNYDALTLGAYMRVNAVLETDADELQKQVEIIAILADKSPDEVLLLPLTDYAEFAKQTAFLRVPCKPAEVGEGWRLGELVPVMDYRKINTAQYVDFQTFAKGFPGTLPELLSVFLVPEGKAYNDGYDVAEVQERVRAVPFPVALGLAAFFFEQFLKLTADSLTSWEAEMRKTKNEREKEKILIRIMQVQEILRAAGVGLPM